MIKKITITVILTSFIFLGTINASTEERLEELILKKEKVEEIREVVFALFSQVEKTENKEIEEALKNIKSSIDKVGEKIENEINVIQENIYVKQKNDEELIYEFLKEEIKKRHRERTQEIEELKAIISLYDSMINSAEKEKEKVISSSPCIKQPTFIPTFFGASSGNVEQSSSYDEEKCDNLRRSYDEKILDVRKNKQLAVMQNWPRWSSSEKWVGIPEIELFEKKEVIKINDISVVIKAFRKSDGGYLLEIDDEDVGFEVIPLAGDDYYLKKLTNL